MRVNSIKYNQNYNINFASKRKSHSPIPTKRIAMSAAVAASTALIGLGAYNRPVVNFNNTNTISETSENSSSMTYGEFRDLIYNYVNKKEILAYDLETGIYDKFINIDKSFIDDSKKDSDEARTANMYNYLFTDRIVSTTAAIAPSRLVKNMETSSDLYATLELMMKEITSDDNSLDAIDKGKNVSYYEYLSVLRLLIAASEDGNEQVSKYADKCIEIFQNGISVKNVEAVNNTLDALVYGSDDLNGIFDDGGTELYNLMDEFTKATADLRNYCADELVNKDSLSYDNAIEAYGLLEEYESAADGLYEFMGVDPRCNFSITGMQQQADDVLLQMKDALLEVDEDNL